MKKMGVAQLVEWSLLISEVRGSNAVNGQNYIEHLFTTKCFEETKVKKLEAGNVAFFKKR